MDNYNRASAYNQASATLSHSVQRLLSDQVFRLLVNQVMDYAIFMLTPTGEVATWNAGAQRIKGYPPDEIIGNHFRVF